MLIIGSHYDKTRPAAAVDAIAKEPFDSVVATAALARAALIVTEDRVDETDALMAKTLDSWVASRRELIA